jgi:arginine/ornithine permease
LVGIASGESENPRETLPRAINQTVYRTILFFGLAIFVMAALIPYEQAGVLKSPFVVVLDKVGIPYAADIMNFIIITAYLSVANSGLYACTRMLYSLSKNKLGPSVLERVNRRGVPMNALIVSMAVASMSLLTYFMNAENVFNLLITIAGSTAVFAWMSIAASQYFFRKKYLAEGGKLEDLPFRTPLYPWVPILAFVLNLITFLSQALDPSTVDYVIYAIPTVILCYVIYYLFVHKHHKAHMEAQNSDKKMS